MKPITCAVSKIELATGELDRLDREHLLEELESMSRSERLQLRNRLIVLVLHLAPSPAPKPWMRSIGQTLWNGTDHRELPPLPNVVTTCARTTRVAPFSLRYLTYRPGRRRALSTLT